MTMRKHAKPSLRTRVPRACNALIWLVCCGLAGTGLLLAFRLPPGSRGGRGLSVLGYGRHEWGDFHTWLAYVFIALVVVHLALHWRWFWQIAARKRSWPLLLGLGGGLALVVVIVILPVAKNDEGTEHHDSEQTGMERGSHQNRRGAKE